MPGSGTSTFTDPDNYQAALPWARIDLLVTPRGFKARLTWAELHCLRLLHSEEELAHIAYVSLPPTLAFVTFPTDSAPPPVWGGIEMQIGEFMFHSCGERLHQSARGPCLWSLVALPQRDLDDYGRALSGRALTAPPSGRVLRPAPRAAARLRRLHAQACRLAERRANIWPIPRFREPLNRV